MAISKTQNERPAIIALIDASNAQAQNIATLTEGLADEISDREQAIENEIQARTIADSDIQDQIGEGFSAELSVAQSLSATNQAVVGIEQDLSSAQGSIQTLQTWQNRFRLGTTPSITVETGDSTSDTLSFNTPFANDAEVAVYLVCVDGSEILTDLSCKLISATYSGFSFAVFNDSQADVTIKVGFLAVRMN